MLLVRHTNDDKIEAGIDEAGRGSFWGPIMAGAVIWPKESEWSDAHRAISTQIKDSKKIKKVKNQILLRIISSKPSINRLLEFELGTN